MIILLFKRIEHYAACWSASRAVTRAARWMARRSATSSRRAPNFTSRTSWEPSGEVFENRPSPKALALSTLYLMREGIPSLLQQNDFLMVQLPELSRLKCYGCKVSTYTHARRFTQAMLYDERLAKR